MQQSDPAIGKVIDGYRILDLLGKGGMGIVYKAEDIALSRIVALKMIAPDLASQDSFLRRFQSEARALARVDSPYIVSIHALRKSGVHVFIIMEFVDGWTLADELNKGALEMKRYHSILKQMLQAFAHAHSVGVIHRDIKPSNIMLSKSGRVKVTDFGLAKLRREDGMSTVTQGIAGTARYMSPEQVQGKKIDHRSDIYSLGMTMYETLAGKLPFGPEEGTYQILRRVVEEEFPLVSDVNPDVPEELARVVARAIEKDPENRYQTAEEMMAAAEEAFQGLIQKEENTISLPSKPLATSSKKGLLIAASFLILITIYPLYLFVTGGIDVGKKEATPVRDEGVLGANGGIKDTASVQETVHSFLTVSGSPEGAEVLLNGVPVGTMPLNEHQVAPGQVEISVRLDGYETEDRMVSLEPGASQNVPFSLEEVQEEPVSREVAENPPPVSDPQPVVLNRMVLRVEPAGDIYVGDQHFSNSSNREWPIGTYDLRFVDPDNNERTCVRSVTLSEGEPLELTCYLEHDVNFQTIWDRGPVAPSVGVTITGAGGATSIYTPKSVPLKAGTYEIEAHRFGYTIENAVRTLEIEPTFDVGETTHKMTFSVSPEADTP